MILHFNKYHGAGNDFIMVDNRCSVISPDIASVSFIAHLCNRHLGIGADGLILINKSTDFNFSMVYFNADGKEGSMCGNGGRCAVAFSHELGLIKEKTIFSATDGLHEAFVIAKEGSLTRVRLKMKDVMNVKKTDDAFILDTGSPHYVCFVNDVKNLDVYHEGRKIRYGNAFKDQGINVDFAEINEDSIFVRTYERGVEDETLSCGTGVTATALAASLAGFYTGENICHLRTLGGDLMVSFNKINESSFNEIWLEGPAICSFNGEINI